MKKNILISLIIICLGVVFFFYEKEDKNKTVENKTVSMCYADFKKVERGYDNYWLVLNLNGNNVSGQYDSYPAEKDLKIGKFTGTVSPLDQKNATRTADVWWSSQAEGVNAKEELLISFGEANASIGAGDMADRGDGVYVYTDKTKIFYTFSLPRIDCEKLNEVIAVQKYVKENIKTIATNKSVLGGSWYVLSLIVNPFTRSGEVLYEDGHVQSRAKFEYDFENTNITIKNFEPEKD